MSDRLIAFSLPKPSSLPEPLPDWYLSLTHLPLTFDLSPMEYLICPQWNMETRSELGWVDFRPLGLTFDLSPTDGTPLPGHFRQLPTRVVDLHPLTIAQNARISGGGNVSLVPTQAITVGAVETWKAERVSIWHAGNHDNPFGQRLTALMISQRVVDTAVPMSLLADHPNVRFNYFLGGLSSCEIAMH
jgi:hypothetical protein